MISETITEAVAEGKPLTPRSILRRNNTQRSPVAGAGRKRVTFEVRVWLFATMKSITSTKSARCAYRVHQCMCTTFFKFKNHECKSSSVYKI